MARATILANTIPEFADPVEILGNLLYLIKLDATDSQKVKVYVDIADGPLRLISQIIRRELAFGGNSPLPSEKATLAAAA
jgi:hypothetical protein